MKITRNEDGTVTVAVPQSPEVYDQTDGQLYVAETLSAEALEAALNPPDAEGDPVA